jgi:hypothetical protein
MPRGYRPTCQWKTLQLPGGQVRRIGVALPGKERGGLVARVIESPRGAETLQGNVQPTTSILKVRSANRKEVDQSCGSVTEIKSRQRLEQEGNHGD